MKLAAYTLMLSAGLYSRAALAHDPQTPAVQPATVQRMRARL
jgi:hypothetical protein